MPGIQSSIMTRKIPAFSKNNEEKNSRVLPLYAGHQKIIDSSSVSWVNRPHIYTPRARGATSAQSAYYFMQISQGMCAHVYVYVWESRRRRFSPICESGRVKSKIPAESL